MNDAISIKIVADDVTPAVREFIENNTPARVGGRLGPPLQKMTMEHLAALGGNVRGYPSTRFYEKFARNVRWLPDPGGVVIAILPAVVQGRKVGLHLRVFGGMIAPQPPRKMLAIPISPVSYGRVPSDFPGLFLLKTHKAAYLVQRGQEFSTKTGRMVGKSKLGGNAGRRLKAELNFLFVLKSSVIQAGNRNVLPSDEEYLNTALVWAGKRDGGLN